MNKNVMQDWTFAIPFMQQTVLLTAIRGPDGTTKYHPVKFLLRWYRRCILLSAMDGRVLDDPTEKGGGSFTGPSLVYPDTEDCEPWEVLMEKVLISYMQQLDEIPHHFQMHFLHAVEIIGYKHPDLRIRTWWHTLYLRLVNDLHLHPETIAELNERLGDSREGWLKRADIATQR